MEGVRGEDPQRTEQTHSHAHGGRILTLSLAALGVVFGDIGTSPLYAIRECFHGHSKVSPDPLNVLGIMSLIFWAIVIIISLKYLIFILRADNRGEGGILALFALVLPRAQQTGFLYRIIIVLGLFGAALLYGDGIITPAISVLSAIEGLEVATPVFKSFVVPAAMLILFLLFLFQHFGTTGIGAVFGPITLLWFTAIGILGAISVYHTPEILVAISPTYAAEFFVRNGMEGFAVLGSVFLAVTGGEALYADMGHFGKKPIRLNWFCFVLPSLLLSYFGQSALILRQPDAVHNPFYRLVPTMFLYPMVILATLAAVIASQAVISGAFSLTRQAVQLGYCPRLQIIHTSPRTIGQIYIPSVNWALMIGTLLLVLNFRSSTNLASAYGIAVTMTMVITTLLAYIVAGQVWKWTWWKTSLVFSFFLIIDMAFLSSNLLKIHNGGWLPLVVGAVIYLMMSTWKRGRGVLAERLGMGSMPLEEFLTLLKTTPPVRVPGCAVFMTASNDGVPITLLHHLKHNKALHKQIILLTLVTEEVPAVPRSERATFQEHQFGLFRIIGHYGFMEHPHVPALLRQCQDQGLELNLDDTTFYLGRETLLPSIRPALPLWQTKLFAFMSRNAQRATDFFRIPTNRVVEVGVQIKL